MRHSVSDTAEFGDYVAGPQIVNAQTKETMRQLLARIQDGTFARDWIEENETGRNNFNCARKQDIDHPIERVGRDLRRMMPFIQPKEVRPGQGGA
jgi:ketol-acid reductoisomerase